MSIQDDDVKPWYTSKTVWGGAVALLGGVAGMFGYVLAPEDQETLTGLLTAVGAAAGGILSIIGRVTATRRIGKETSGSEI